MALPMPHDETLPATTPLQDTVLPDDGPPVQSPRSERSFLPSQEQDNEEETQGMSSRKRARVPNLPALQERNELAQDPTHPILASEKDNETFFHMANHPGATLKTIRKLEVHLDTKKVDEYAAFRLALALTELHPRSDGQNPHQLHTIQLVVSGKMLFTRYSYHMASPATSDLVGQNLKKFLSGGLTKEEKSGLAFKLSSTETPVANALLGIRGVSQVIIEGKGKMEGCFAETLKATLVQPTGTGIVEFDDPTLPYSTPAMNRVGTIKSEAYLQAALRSYPTVSIATKYDFSSLKAKERYLVDERAQLLQQLLGLPEDDPMSLESSAPTKHARRSLPEFDVSFAPDLPRDTRKRKHDHDVGLGMSDMVRIRTQEQGVEMVELGWKV